MITVLTQGSDSGQWTKVPELAFFFALGVYGKALLIRIAEVRKLVHAAVAIPLFLGLSGISLALDLNPVVDQALFILRGLAAIVALVAVISALTRNRGIAAAGSWVGKRTLGIYVLHVPVMDGIVLAFHGPLGPAAPVIANSVTMAFIYPLALTAAVALACTGLEYLLKKCGLSFLFRRPQAKTAARHRQPV
ncbi:acyltransferase family protein [Arthrobacter sp. 754]|uniref:acyltransferase family protein n=1 Tax=Arthrobacter sp. 754 TaxID=3156315 RepID=UPI003397CDAC